MSLPLLASGEIDTPWNRWIEWMKGGRDLAPKTLQEIERSIDNLIREGHEPQRMCFLVTDQEWEQIAAKAGLSETDAGCLIRGMPVRKQSEVIRG